MSSKYLALTVALIVALSGCSSATVSPSASNESSSQASQQSAEDGASDAIEVDEGLLTIDITFPESFVSMGGEQMTQEKVDEAVAEAGYLGGKLNEDGSVTYTMTKLKHREMMDEISKSFDDSIKESLAEYPNIKAITRKDDFSEISIEVSEQDIATGFLALGFSMTAYFYQVLDGKDFSTDIVFLDASTGEELSRTSYPISD